MPWALAWGMSCGTENIPGPMQSRVTHQHRSVPSSAAQGLGVVPSVEPAQRDLVALYKGSSKSSQCRFQLEVDLEQTQALTVPEFENVSLRARFWCSCGSDSPVWALASLSVLTTKNIAALEPWLKPSHISWWSELSSLKRASSRKLLVIYSNISWVLFQVVVLAPRVPKRMFPFLLKEQAFISFVLAQAVVSWHRSPLAPISAGWFAL